MKKFLISCCLSLVALALSAQRLGPVAGYQLTTPFPMTSRNVLNFNEQVGSGFHVGLLFDWDITNRWGVEASAVYNLRSSSYDLEYKSDTTTHFSRQLYFLDIPVHAYVNFPMKKWTLSLFAGPSFNIGLHGKDIAWQNTDMQKPVMLETDDIFGDDGRLTRFEIAAELGLAAKYKNYEVRASYEVGLNNIAKQDYAWTVGLPSTTTKRFQQGELKLSFAYLFYLGK